MASIEISPYKYTDEYKRRIEAVLRSGFALGLTAEQLSKHPLLFGSDPEQIKLYVSLTEIDSMPLYISSPQDIIKNFRQQNDTTKDIIIKMVSKGLPPSSLFILFGFTLGEMNEWLDRDEDFARKIESGIRMFELSTLSKLVRNGKEFELLKKHPVLGSIYEDKPNQINTGNVFNVQFGFTQDLQSHNFQEVLEVDKDDFNISNSNTIEAIAELPDSFNRDIVEVPKNPRADIDKHLEKVKKHNLKLIKHEES